MLGPRDLLSYQLLFCGYAVETIPHTVDRMKSNRPRLSIKALLVVMAFFAGAAATVSQYGMGNAEFEIQEISLSTNSFGKIQGVVKLDYWGVEHDDPIPWPIVCHLQHVPNPQLLTLTKGKRSTIRYRFKKMGPLKREDPHSMYFSKVLGIKRNHIVGYAITEVDTQVVIDGRPRK